MEGQKKSGVKFSIANKLALCFTAAILVLVVTIGVVFTVLFRDYSKDVYHDNMKKTARSISSLMTSILKENGSPFQKNPSGGGLYDSESGIYGSQDSNIIYFNGPALIRMINKITDTDVWIVDSFYNILSTSKDSEAEFSSQYGYDTLPALAQEFVSKIFEDTGYEVYGEGFSSVLGTDTMTVGVPVYAPNGTVNGAILLHTPMQGMTQAINRGLFILLMSLIVALVIGSALSLILSHTIVKPLTKINRAAQLLSEGDYAVHTNVRRRDEIGELALTMDDMGGKLMQAEEESAKLQKMRQDFVANISHELRTPVTVLRGSLEALCDGVVTSPEMVAEYHKQLLGETIYMQRLVNDLLDLSRLQNPDFSINISEFNLYDCISDAVRSGRKIAEKKGAALKFLYDTQVYMVTGDYDRVRQMLLIILDNAVKFTDNTENPVTIRLEQGAVSITNVGPGIQKEDLPMIFERFYKSRSEQNKNGTGLGLAIAKQIASRHGIGISVSSICGGETTFQFVFPAKI